MTVILDMIIGSYEQAIKNTTGRMVPWDEQRTKRESVFLEKNEKRYISGP